MRSGASKFRIELAALYTKMAVVTIRTVNSASGTGTVYLIYGQFGFWDFKWGGDGCELGEVRV